MFTIRKADAKTNAAAAIYGQDRIIVDAVSLSTDTKPTDGIANGSMCIEIDTGDLYAFNESGSAWVKIG